jgi:hypothetical protein
MAKVANLVQETTATTGTGTRHARGLPGLRALRGSLRGRATSSTTSSRTARTGRSASAPSARATRSRAPPCRRRWSAACYATTLQGASPDATGAANGILKRDAAGVAYASQFTSLVATGTAPLVVNSTTQVNNLNAQYLAGFAASQSATGSTVAVRNSSGYINAVYFNTSAGQENLTPSSIFFEYANDGYLRKMTLANVVAFLNSGGAVTQDWVGRPAFKSNTGALGNATGGYGSLEIATNGASTDAAYMCFHRRGYFATYFGLDTDNDFKIGGWSNGSNAYRVFSQANRPYAHQFTTSSFAMTMATASVNANAASGGFTITLPPAGAWYGMSHEVVIRRTDNVGGNVVTISKNASDTAMVNTSGSSVSTTTLGINSTARFITDGGGFWIQTT